MSGDDLCEMRGDRSAQEFGVFVADVMGKERPYTAQEIWNWEKGLRAVPGRVATALRMYESRHWLIVPYGCEFLFRVACPICGGRNPKIVETERSVVIRFNCGAAERLANQQRKDIGMCSNRNKVLGVPE